MILLHCTQNLTHLQAFGAHKQSSAPTPTCDNRGILVETEIGIGVGIEIDCDRDPDPDLDLVIFRVPGSGACAVGPRSFF